MKASNRARPTTDASPVWTLTGYLGLFLGVVAVASFVGSYSWTPEAVWSSFWNGEGDAFPDWVDFRVRRLLFAAVVGASLSWSGVVFQAVLRNPLAEPYVLGVSSGASFGVLLTLVAAGGAAWGTTVGALAGSLGAITLLLALVRFGRLRDSASLILAGVVLNAVFGALTLLAWTFASEHQAMASLFFVMGNLGAEVVQGTPHLLIGTVAVGVAFGCGRFLARPLDLLALGDDEAASLGHSPERLRLGALVIASALTAVVVAGAGPIGFVGLIVPHILRRLHGPRHRELLPLALIGGAIFLVVADTSARATSSERVFPVGAMTALAGGPFFLFLLCRARRRDAD